MQRKVLVIIGFLILAGVIGLVEVAAQGPKPGAPRAPVGTGITYQGQLKSGANLYTGTCNFQFGLYDAATLGSQVGLTQTVTSVGVLSGLFTAPIDFGAGAFNGDARYLNISVQCPAGVGSYVPFTSRQPLTAAPYALYATTANAANSAITATTATTATNLSGSLGGDVTGTQTNTTVTKLQGRTVASTAPGSGQVLGWNGSQWAPATAGVNYQNVVVVAKSGGNYTTIGDALASITTAADANRYLVKVMPGVYYEQVVMKPYIDIEGSGELTTKITYTGSADGASGTVVGANNAELRFLTVENTGGNLFAAIAIYDYGVSPRLTHVTATASGGATHNQGIYNTQSSAPTMTDVTAKGTGGLYARGINNDYASSPTMTNVSASASGGVSSNAGVRNYSSTATMTNVVGKGTGGVSAYGVENQLGSPKMTNVTAMAVEASTNYGVNNWTSSPVILNSSISASEGTTNYGIYNSASFSVTVKINTSKITASTNTIYNNSSGNTVYIGGSQMDGGPVYNVAGSAITCAGVYDENFVFSASACP